MTPEREAAFLDGIKSRLKYYGLTIQSGDTTKDNDIKFSINLCNSRVCTFCNIDDIPTSADDAFIDMCACDYLSGRLNSGQMPINDIVNIAQTIKVGDTQVSYGQVGAAETILLKYMTDRANSISPFMSFRKIRW